MRAIPAFALVILGLLAGPCVAVASEASSFAGKPVESRDWSRLCIERDGDYLAGQGDSNNPFVECASAGDAAAKAASCQRRCAQATSDCIAVVGGTAGRPNACFDYNAACMSRCKGE
jgi:hypothetical protein